MAKTTEQFPRRDNESIPMYRARIRDIRMKAKRARMLDRWSHKQNGTPETHEHAFRQRQGAIARLFQLGYIDTEQLQWACDIAQVAEWIANDVDLKCPSYEMRVDNQGSAKNVLAETIWRVRYEVAYSWWRQNIPEPKKAVLEMLIGEQQPYSAVAIRFKMGKKRCRGILIRSIDLWGEALDLAEASVDKDNIERVRAVLA